MTDLRYEKRSIFPWGRWLLVIQCVLVPSAQKDSSQWELYIFSRSSYRRNNRLTGYWKALGLFCFLGAGRGGGLWDCCTVDGRLNCGSKFVNQTIRDLSSLCISVSYNGLCRLSCNSHCIRVYLICCMYINTQVNWRNLLLWSYDFWQCNYAWACFVEYDF